MGAQIYTAVEARAIVSACRAQRETWRQIGAHDPAFRVDAEYRARIDREESLAASVEHHAARAERAEAERDAAIKRATNAERMRDAFVATSVAFAVDMIDKPDAMARCAAERDAAVAQAEELTRALRVAQGDLARALADGRVELRQRADDAERVAADMLDDLERLRAAVREADEAAQHVYAASVAERIGQPYAAAKVAAIIARQDAACAALRALMPTEVSRG